MPPTAATGFFFVNAGDFLWLVSLLVRTVDDIYCLTYEHVFANSTRRRQKSGEQPYKRKRTLHLLCNPLHAFSKAVEQSSMNLRHSKLR
ncbi:MAG: hypothetical protein FRX49_03823 [Trebouxia sp. A1-2]|nr:MAG: hypothetical protein FRX49_03823 [Trebouxia sp. A1-2]